MSEDKKQVVIIGGGTSIGEAITAKLKKIEQVTVVDAVSPTNEIHITPYDFKEIECFGFIPEDPNKRKHRSKKKRKW